MGTTVQQVSDITGVNRLTIHHWISTHKIPRPKTMIGGMYLLDESEVNAIVAYAQSRGRTIQCSLQPVGAR